MQEEYDPFEEVVADPEYQAREAVRVETQVGGDNEVDGLHVDLCSWPPPPLPARVTVLPTSWTSKASYVR